jgi:hypothetical protein
MIITSGPEVTRYRTTWRIAVHFFTTGFGFSHERHCCLAWDAIHFQPSTSSYFPRRSREASLATAQRTNLSRLLMNDATKRSTARWIHLVFSIPILGYVYSPFEELPNYAPVVRFVSIPVLVLTGLWMWKGHVFRRLISRRST